MWANMRTFKVGVTRSLRASQIAELRNNYTTYMNLRMFKVDLCANGAGAYAPYAPPLPTGLCMKQYLPWVMLPAGGVSRSMYRMEEGEG